MLFKEPLPVLSKLDSACALTTLPTRPKTGRTILSPRSIVECPCVGPCGRRRRNHSRKEVIQPQVLLQLPCYDFTPITDHTLDASLPCGLVWRLLVQPAFVM